MKTKISATKGVIEALKSRNAIETKKGVPLLSIVKKLSEKREALKEKEQSKEEKETVVQKDK